MSIFPPIPHLEFQELTKKQEYIFEAKKSGCEHRSLHECEVNGEIWYYCYDCDEMLPLCPHLENQ